jgi:CheY-like chemotaxis protein
MMPGMSGFELTEGIHQVRADIPVLLTSGYLQAEDTAESGEPGHRRDNPEARNRR